MKNRKIVIAGICLCVLLAAAVVAAGLWLFMEREVPLELVYTYRDTGRYDAGLKSLREWKTVHATGFWTGDMFEEEFREATGQSAYDAFGMDTERYTYVICYGGSLERLVYSEAYNPWYYGRAYIREESDGNIANVYRTEKIRIEKDPHTNDPSAAYL